MCINMTGVILMWVKKFNLKWLKKCEEFRSLLVDDIISFFVFDERSLFDERISFNAARKLWRDLTVDIYACLQQLNHTVSISPHCKFLDSSKYTGLVMISSWKSELPSRRYPRCFKFKLYNCSNILFNTLFRYIVQYTIPMYCPIHCSNILSNIQFQYIVLIIYNFGEILVFSLH